MKPDDTPGDPGARDLARQLAESEQRYHDLVAFLPVGVYVARTRADGTTTFDVFSPQAGALVGVAPADALATPSKVMEAVHPDDRPRLIAALADLYRRPRQFAWEGRVFVRGEERVLRAAAQPGAVEDDELVTLGFFEDVTDQHKVRADLAASEERHRQLAELATDVVLRTDGAGCIEWASPSVVDVLGWQVESLTGIAYWELIHPADAEAVRAAVLSGDQSGRAAFRARHRRMDGLYRMLQVTVRPIFDRRGRLLGRIAGAHDVTEQVENEETLRDAGLRLAQSERLEAVGRLAGGVAHDFNNLLAAVTGHIEVAGERLGVNDAAREDLDLALDAAHRAASLARQLLAFGRRQALRPTDVDLARQVASLVPLLRGTMGDDVSVELRQAPGLWTVRADPSRLEHVVVSLALNAREAMPAGGSLTLELENRVVGAAEAARHVGVSKGRFATLAVRDTGRGIPPDVLPHLFEPFFTTKEMGHGAGLGLATVEGTLAQMGGWIEAHSEVGRGSTFILHLPLVAPTVTLEGRSADALAVATAVPASGVTAAVGPTDEEDRRWSILLVEDEDLVRATMTRVLRDVGYRVVAVGSADAALELETAVVAEIDVLVTDVVMPGMDGATLAGELARSRPGLPVVFISGFARDLKEELTEQLRRPGTTFLQKPFRRDELAAAVRRVLGTG